MARIPDPRRVGNETLNPLQTPAPSAEAFGAGIGRALQGIGEQGSRIAADMQARNTNARLSALQTELDEWETANVIDGQNGALSKSGNVEGLTVETQSAYEEAFAGRIEGLPRAAQDRALQLITRKRQQVARTVSGHEAREMGRYRSSVYNGVIAGALLNSQNNFSDPERLGQEWVSVQEATARRVALGEMSDEEANARLMDWRQKQLQSAGDAWVAADLNGARQFLQANSSELGQTGAARLQDRIDRETRARDAQFRAAQARTQAIAKAELEVGILEGRIGQEDIDAAYDAGNLSPGGWATLRKGYDTEQDRARKEAEAFELVVAGGQLDPTDSDHRDAVDMVFKSTNGIEGLVGLDPETATIAAEMADANGIVPPTVQSFVRGALASGNDAQRQYAYDLVGRLDEAAPAALDRAFTGPELAEANHYLKLTRAGVSDEQAMQTIEANRSMDQATRDQRMRDGAEAFEDVDVGNDFFDPSILPFDQGVLPSHSPIADRIREDARVVFQDAYVRTGDADVAKDAARRTLAKTYGQSDVVRSGVVMQYPPEAYYAVPGFDNDWMKTQLMEDVGAVVPGVSEDRIELVATSETAADVRAGRLPRYRVLVQDENGIYEPVMSENGDVMDYRFDQKKARDEYAQKLKIERDEFLKSEGRAPHNLVRRALGLGEDDAEAPNEDEPTRAPEFGLGVAN